MDKTITIPSSDIGLVDRALRERMFKLHKMKNHSGHDHVRNHIDDMIGRLRNVRDQLGYVEGD